MTYVIQTEEFHTAALARNSAEASRRFHEQLDVGDCALSSWSNDSMSSFHNLALTCLKQGKDGKPADYFRKLIDGERILDARVIKGQFGYVWLLGDKEATHYGRRFVPTGERSRVQKQLGLSEGQQLEECSRVINARCAFIGGCVQFITMPVKK